jgi:hypothetical protein
MLQNQICKVGIVSALRPRCRHVSYIANCKNYHHVVGPVLQVGIVLVLRRHCYHVSYNAICKYYHVAGTDLQMEIF